MFERSICTALPFLNTKRMPRVHGTQEGFHEEVARGWTTNLFLEFGDDEGTVRSSVTIDGHDIQDGIRKANGVEDYLGYPVHRCKDRLTDGERCDTLCLMKEISIRELHAHTGACVREAAEWGRIIVKDRGHPVAAILPYKEEVHGHTLFAERKLARGFATLPRMEGDCTLGISDDRGQR